MGATAGQKRKGAQHTIQKSSCTENESIYTPVQATPNKGPIRIATKFYQSRLYILMPLFALDYLTAVRMCKATN